MIKRIPTYARRDVAKSTADKLTQNYSAPIIPVLEIAESNGVDVIFTDFGDHSQTVAGFCDFASAKLYVNVEDRSTRQSFTIAHELGHWLMHKSIFENDPDKYPVLPRFQSVDKSDTLEQEANAFAANLLVPSRLLSPVKHVPVAKLAEVFGVSRMMMEIRIKNA